MHTVCTCIKQEESLFKREYIWKWDTIIEGKEMMDDKSLSQTVDWNSRSVHGVPVDVVALRHIVSCSKYFISRGSASKFQTQDVFVP